MEHLRRKLQATRVSRWNSRRQWQKFRNFRHVASSGLEMRSQNFEPGTQEFKKRMGSLSGTRSAVRHTDVHRVFAQQNFGASKLALRWKAWQIIWSQNLRPQRHSVRCTNVQLLHTRVVHKGGWLSQWFRGCSRLWFRASYFQIAFFASQSSWERTN